MRTSRAECSLSPVLDVDLGVLEGWEQRGFLVLTASEVSGLRATHAKLCLRLSAHTSTPEIYLMLLSNVTPIHGQINK